MVLLWGGRIAEDEAPVSQTGLEKPIPGNVSALVGQELAVKTSGALNTLLRARRAHVNPIAVVWLWH